MGRRRGEDGEERVEERMGSRERERKRLKSYSIDGQIQITHTHTHTTHVHTLTGTGHACIFAVDTIMLSHGEWGKSPSSVSCPVHCTSSRWMGPGTDPN